MTHMQNRTVPRCPILLLYCTSMQDVWYLPRVLHFSAFHSNSVSFNSILLLDHNEPQCINSIDGFFYGLASVSRHLPKFFSTHYAVWLTVGYHIQFNCEPHSVQLWATPDSVWSHALHIITAQNRELVAWQAPWDLTPLLASRLSRVRMGVGDWLHS